MILGFGNNVVSALASEITSSQKTIPVMPGTGAKFEALLTQDNANSSTDLKAFAKITLTDSGETEFEICHLLSVSGDVLSVLRGQEGTAAKGWMLNDVVANFATRGSENQFVQVDHLQSGFYCAGVAGGSANALTLSLPSSFFLNGATDWMLRTPVIVYPTQNNTGAATLQLTMGGVVLGTFPLYKGDKKQLVANDILKDVALVCLLDISKTFFNVSNPGAIYAGLGTAAFLDVTTSARDTTPNRVLKTADYGIGRAIGTITTGIDFKSFAFIQGEHLFVKMDTCTNIPAGLNAATYYYIFVKGMRDSDGSPCIELVKYDTPSEVWNAYGAGAAGARVWTLYRSFNSGYKQTAADTGAMPYYGTALSVDLNTLGPYSAAGVYYQPGNAGATTAFHYPIAEAGSLVITPSAYGCQQEYTTFGTGRKFVRGLSAVWNGNDGPWSAWKEYFQSTGGAVSGTINQDSVAQATYKYTALSTATTGVKNYLRKMRGGSGDTIWHETVQAGEFRISTGNTDAQDELVISSAGRVTFRGEVVSKSANGFRIAYGTYGVFLRSDGNNTYLLLTASGDPLGNYNSLRPFSVNNATGDVTIGKLTLSNYASFDARYLTASSTLTRLGAQVVVNVPNNATVSAPAGCVSSAIKCGNSGALTGLGYRPLQILVNGTWVNVQSL